MLLGSVSEGYESRGRETRTDHLSYCSGRAEVLDSGYDHHHCVEKGFVFQFNR